MSSINYNRGDGVFRTRLEKAIKETGERVRKIKELRSNVFIIYTTRGKYLLKGFHNRHKLEAQSVLLKKLEDRGFYKTYNFVRDMPTFKYDGEIYAWIEYLKPKSEKFSFQTSSNRSKGLYLLEEFHSATSTFYEQIPVNRFDQVEKWEERLDDFKYNSSIVRKYVKSSYIESWLDWGKKSLAGLVKYERDLYKEPLCIVHGDVAHHNFFLKADGSLNIIDFDLISKAPPLIDYLQYSNRIMPFLADSKELFSYKQLQRYKDNPAFLYALLFPTDIFREWNRIIKDNALKDNRYLHSVWKLTAGEWKHRTKLYKEIAGML
ncbi:MAG: phosphotransferase [Bacillus sp. (in: firmicutes)]